MGVICKQTKWVRYGAFLQMLFQVSHQKKAQKSSPTCMLSQDFFRTDTSLKGLKFSVLNKSTSLCRWLKLVSPVFNISSIICPAVSRCPYLETKYPFHPCVCLVCFGDCIFHEVWKVNVTWRKITWQHETAQFSLFVAQRQRHPRRSVSQTALSSSWANHTAMRTWWSHSRTR